MCASHICTHYISKRETQDKKKRNKIPQENKNGMSRFDNDNFISRILALLLSYLTTR